MKQDNRCPSQEVIERAYWASDGVLDEHRSTCASCAAVWREIDSLAALAAELETPEVDLESLRTTTLARASAAADGSPSRLPWLVAGGALCLAAGLLLYFAVPSKSVPLELAELVPSLERGTVVGDNADFERVASQPDELIRLVSGSIDVEVDPLGPGERFRVVTADAEIEVRGTAFRVTAEDGKLVSVAVSEGLVVVRVGSRERELGAGERWELLAAIAPPAAKTEPTEPVRTEPPPPVQRPPQAKISTAAPTDRVARRPETAYERGWTHLRQRDYVAAGSEFERAIDSADAADALYWAAVAHFRAGKKERSRVLLRRFLGEKKRDKRFTEAAVMLGWIEIERENFKEARRLFDLGKDSRSDRVRKSAEAGLEAIDKR